MSNRQLNNKPKGELPISQHRPPEESEPEYPERIIFSPFECLLHFADFPELHNLAQAAQREGRSGLTYHEIEEAKSRIIARGEDKEARAQIIDQHLAARIDQPYGYQAQTPQQSARSSPDLPVHPQSPSQEPEPEVARGKIYSLSSPSENPFHLWDFPQLFQLAPAEQCEGRSGIPFFEILKAKAKITAQLSSALAKKPRHSQEISDGASFSETTGNTNITLVPRGDAQTSCPVPSFIYTAGRTQREST
jgi:hypothetical protein